jgi:hypothetical protein
MVWCKYNQFWEKCNKMKSVRKEKLSAVTVLDNFPLSRELWGPSRYTALTSVRTQTRQLEWGLHNFFTVIIKYGNLWLTCSQKGHVACIFYLQLKPIIFEISGSHRGEYEEYSIWDTAACSFIETDWWQKQYTPLKRPSTSTRLQSAIYQRL